MKAIRWVGAVAAMAAALVAVPSAVATAAESAEAPMSLVEDYAYPGAAQVLVQHNLKVFKGDGHIQFVESIPFNSDGKQCSTGQIQVEKNTPDTVPYGVYYCFRTQGTSGFLTLEVPATFGIRGGTTPVEATAELPTGEKTYDINPGAFVAINPGSGTEVPQAILVELRLTTA